MEKVRGSGHWLGVFLLVVVALAVFTVSVTLSLIFFRSITPPGNGWFTYFGLSLTEGGFLCWLGAFFLVRHHGFHTAVEFIMACASLAGILATAGVELFSLMPGTSIDVHTPLIANVVGMVLEAIFMANIISVFIAAIVFYSEANPGWFRGGGQFAYSAQPEYQIEEQRGEPARPLASPHRKSKNNQPKAEPATFDQEAEIETSEIEEQLPIDELIGAPKNLPPMRKPRRNPPPIQSPVKRPPPLQTHQGDTLGDMLKEGVSSLTQKLRGFTRRGRTAAHVRGKTNQTTNENM